ncbi:MAG: hypothetical protein JW763_00350 [candidate division Zixibacteria bacterium]|nr:hypothetical protein [candidate division Zixibacteria bacterium]
MPVKHALGTVMMLVVALFCLTVVCSDDDSVPTGPGDGWSSVNFADYEDLIGDIAPPVYTEPLASPSEIDPMWTSTFLNKVFSEQEPMSLYSNLAYFDELVEEIGYFLVMNEEGDIAVDSSLSEGELHSYDVCQITELGSAVPIPTALQGVFGATATVENLATMDFPEMAEDEVLQLGFTINDEEQAVLAFQRMDETEAITVTTLYYFYMDMADSSIVMRGAVYKDYGDETSARWVYDIQSVDESEFAYRMSWYSDPEGELTETMLGCIIGGGDKDVEFALTYREYKPADSTDFYADMSQEQVFGPNYTEGTSLISEFSTFVNADLFIVYGEMPSALLTSPFLTR